MGKDARAALVLVGLLALGCSRERPADPEAGLDLLARRPDAILGSVGEIVADRETLWGELGGFGWETRATTVGRVRCIRASREKAYLNLPAGERRERTLRLTVCAAPADAGGNQADAGEARIEARLNGFLLGTLQARAQPEALEVQAPAPAWLEGDNLLELASPLPEKGRPSFALARVEYDRARRVEVDVDERAVRLEPGTSVRYRIEVLADAHLLLGGSSGGAGTLEVTLVAIDPATGSETPADARTIALPPDQELAQAYALPAGRSPYELRLAWLATSSAELELRRLVVAESAPVARPPIILISIDTLSARHLSAYGYPLPTSPFLERLAAESCVFEQCMTNAPWTLPSFLALMSGLYARAHQLDGPGGGELWERWYLAQNRWTLPEFLHAAGYRTAGFVDNPWLTERFGFPQGFELLDASATADNARSEKDTDAGIRLTAANARRFLDDLSPGTPFFCFVHAFDVHGPYVPPAPFDGSFGDAALYDAERLAPAGGPANVYGIIPTYVARGEAPEDALPSPMRTAPFEGAYDESVRFVDDELGKFYDYLRAQGLLDTAWLIVTADHGETMADSSFYFGHGVLEQDVVHVPLLVRPPGGLPGGKRVSATVQLVDVYPTVLDLLRPGAPRDYLSGRSFLPLVRGDAREPGAALCESGPLRQAMLVAGGWKIVELQPSKDVQRQALLSYPLLDREFLAGAEQALRTELGNQQDPRQRSEREHLLAWKDDRVLGAAFLEELPRTGLTDELLARMEKCAGFPSLLAFLRRSLDRTYYELYELASDPHARKDLARERPDKLRELQALLQQEQGRRDRARNDGRPPTRPLELPQAEADELRALGYGGETVSEDALAPDTTPPRPQAPSPKKD